MCRSKNRTEMEEQSMSFAAIEVALRKRTAVEEELKTEKQRRKSLLTYMKSLPAALNAEIERFEQDGFEDCLQTVKIK